MIIKAYRTHKILPGEDLFRILDKYLPKLEEKSIVVLASKITGICEGRIVKISKKNKKDLIKEEAEFYLPEKYDSYGFTISINNNILVANAGIDESNGNGNYILWPKDPQKTVNMIREYLINKYKLQYLGVILTDSKLTPLRRGVTGVSLAHSGFKSINSYVGKPDIFGKKMQVETLHVADCLASAAVVQMGEGNEQQPIAVITDIPFVEFQKRNPTKKELDEAKISIEDDFFAPLLTSLEWKKRKQKK